MVRTKRPECKGKATGCERLQWPGEYVIERYKNGPEDDYDHTRHHTHNQDNQQDTFQFTH
jgi:hypothetical protein